MGDSFAFFDIVFFALVAGFLILRLRSVLGRRTGGENRERWTPRLPGSAPADTKPPADIKLVADPRLGVPGPGRIGDPPQPMPPSADAPPASADLTPLETRLAQIRAAEPSFDPPEFLAGARVAFEMIVGAFARGDTAALRPLLADDVYDNFAAAIAGRTQAKQTLETTLIGIKGAEIIEARLDNRNALVTVKFVSEQVNVTRNAAGEVVDGDPQLAAAVIDIWTFARRVRASDPNWALVQTSEMH